VAKMLDEFERRHKQAHPTGFEPGLSWNGKVGTITAQLDKEPDDEIWSTLIEDWGLDPSRTMVVDGSLQIRAWDAGNGARHKYYRCTIKPREQVVDRADIEALCKLVEKKKPAKPVKNEAKRAFLVLLSDWQLGKGESGGTEATTARILESCGKAVQRFKDLTKIGKAPSVVYLIGLGDLSEGCSGWYEMQEWQTDLNRREQERLARRLILHFIDAFVDLGVPVIATGVPGNHGENRKNGKAFTDFTDNSDVSVFETVAEIMSANPDRYGDVSVPLNLHADDLTMTLDIMGYPVSFAHGHQFRSGTNSQAKAEGWWKGQALGRTGVSDSEMLCFGHFHHFVMSEATGRTVIQAPAMDGGSKWFTGTSGQSAQAGMVTLTVGSQVGSRGWDDLLIL